MVTLPVNVNIVVHNEDSRICKLIFECLGDYWQLDSCNIQTMRMALKRIRRSFAVAINELKPVAYFPLSGLPPDIYQTDPMGAWRNGYLYRGTMQFDRARIFHDTGYDPNGWKLDKNCRRRLMTNSAGALYVADDKIGILIRFSKLAKQPIHLGVTKRHVRNLKETDRDQFMFHNEGVMIIPVEEIVTRVLRDTTVFVDPLDYTTFPNGDQYIILKPEAKARLRDGKKRE
jgi:hypothetical protein